jgi:hypothetical protein
MSPAAGLVATSTGSLQRRDEEKQARSSADSGRSSRVPNDRGPVL